MSRPFVPRLPLDAAVSDPPVRGWSIWKASPCSTLCSLHANQRHRAVVGKACGHGGPGRTTMSDAYQAQQKESRGVQIDASCSRLNRPRYR